MNECKEIQCCPDDPFATFVPMVPLLFWNTEQCRTVGCPDDPRNTATECVAAGTLSSTLSQGDADYRAGLIATGLAEDALSCTTTYTSTQTVCIDCVSSGGNINLVPQMTSNTTPSGVVSGSYVQGMNNNWRAFDRNAATFTTTVTGNWIAYQFSSAQRIGSYAITNGASGTIHPAYPESFKLEGSNDAVAWTLLDWKTAVAWSLTANQRQEFTISNAVAYTYYRITFINTLDEAKIVAIELIGPETIQICRTATASSIYSQGDADTKASEAALALCQSVCNP